MAERNPPSTYRRGPRARAAEAGFTLLEAIVALAIMTVILVGLLSLLQFNSRVARAQVNVAGMQQSLRVAQAEIVREARMAGRGGLPANRPGLPLPQGAALAVLNNAPDGTTIGGAGGPPVRPGTDVLTIRGVFSTPIYQVSATADGRVGDPTNGTITVRGHGPTGVPQPLEPLLALADLNRPEALLLVGANDDSTQAVVELTGVAQVPGGVQLSFTTEGTQGASYLQLSPGGVFPPELTTISAVGVLEEYRYYIRDEAPAPSLSKARLYPGTNAPHAAAPANLQLDVADNVLDLQVALGIDRDGTEDVEDARNAEDDWLFNHADDTPVTPADWNQPAMRIYYLRISTLARTDRLDPNYTSPPIQAIEDHVYNEPDAPADDASILERRYRRRLLQTVIDLRNL